jgi:[ribosomal protein S18]-alanine N-acetyltransferase
MRHIKYTIRPMREVDIVQISEIDCEAFPGESMFRPFSSYKAEIHNSAVHYSVACTAEPVKLRKLKANTYKPSWYQRFRPHRKIDTSELEIVHVDAEKYIIGFVGLWIMLNEAHITAIATRQNFRRQGIGESLLISAIESSIQLGAKVVTLEVRVSNIIAQSLYLKYGFRKVGKRVRYYSDNNEDALLMSTDNIASDNFKFRFQELKEAHKYNERHH